MATSASPKSRRQMKTYTRHATPATLDDTFGATPLLARPLVVVVSAPVTYLLAQLLI